VIDDQAVIMEVDEMARGFVSLILPLDEPLLPLGTPCHRARVRLVREEWERARRTYLSRTGIDVIAAIKRHEAWLRSPENAPQLYVERR
jgi:hypothetical protein